MIAIILRKAGVIGRRRFWVERLPIAVMLSATFLVFVGILACFASQLAPYEITAMDLSYRLKEPVLFGGDVAHVLGTDQLGRDVASRLFHSIRTTLLVAIGATAISLVVGTVIGFVAAYFRGLAEQAILLVIDVQASLPFLVVALAVLAFFGNSTLLFVGLMGLYGWERNARLARGLALSAYSKGYAEATRHLGAHPLRTYCLHILPNISSTLIVSATILFPEIILAESGLSFLGLGIQPPMTSLGIMVSTGREYIARAPWLLIVPSFVIVGTTLAVSMLGDWLRDRFDRSSS